MPIQGVFELRTARDLLAKARHDLRRLEEKPFDRYAAFDFFVTARHVPDWLYPKDEAKRTALFQGSVELRVCRHIAEGAKHFEPTDKRHKQVGDTAVSPPAFQAGAFQRGAFQTGGISIKLDPADPDTASLGSEIEAIELARRVIAILERVVP